MCSGAKQHKAKWVVKPQSATHQKLSTLNSNHNDPSHNWPKPEVQKKFPQTEQLSFPDPNRRSSDFCSSVKLTDRWIDIHSIGHLFDWPFFNLIWSPLHIPPVWAYRLFCMHLIDFNIFSAYCSITICSCAKLFGQDMFKYDIGSDLIII